MNRQKAGSRLILLFSVLLPFTLGACSIKDSRIKPSECEKTADCGSSSACVQDRCLATCSDDDDCSGSETCQEADGVMICAEPGSPGDGDSGGDGDGDTPGDGDGDTPGDGDGDTPGDGDGDTPGDGDGDTPGDGDGDTSGDGDCALGVFGSGSFGEVCFGE